MSGFTGLKAEMWSFHKTLSVYRRHLVIGRRSQCVWWVISIWKHISPHLYHQESTLYERSVWSCAE